MRVGNGFKDLSGQTFGRWTALSYSGGQKWNCRCECGREFVVFGPSLTRGRSTQCAPCNSPAGKAATHGLSHTPEYGVWLGMKKRCEIPAEKSYPQYGGRGIQVCEQWRGPNGFLNFLRDMGRRPSPDHSIDRKDVDGHYEPSNCRWATASEQANNQRRIRRYQYRERSLTAAEIAQECGTPSARIRERLASGWSLAEATTTPKLARKRKSVSHRGRAKLTHDDVAKIRASSAPSSALARIFGVSRYTIWDVRSGRSWARDDGV